MNFNKRKCILPGNLPQWVFTQVPEGEDQPYPPLQILADKSGVRFEGKSCLITDMRDLQDFAQVVSDAWIEHDKFLKSAVGKIVVSSGKVPDVTL